MSYCRAQQCQTRQTDQNCLFFVVNEHLLYPSSVCITWINSLSPNPQVFIFQMGQFYYAAKAFDVLERLDPNPEYWEGKRGACVGIFQQIIAGHEPR